MGSNSSGISPSKIKAALLTLEKLNIPFRGPFETSKGARIIIIGQCILTQAEVIALHEAGKLDRENIARFEPAKTEGRKLGASHG
jgi:hypothetical protein